MDLMMPKFGKKEKKPKIIAEFGMSYYRLNKTCS